MDYVLGCDVSVWNDINSTPQMTDFDKMQKAGGKFVFIKSSQDTWADPDMVMNWKNAKSSGILRGAYHFLTWTKAVKQAEYMWSLIEKDPGELPPVCDFEHWGIIPSKAYDYVWAFVNRMEELSGRIPIIYTGTYFWAERSTQSAIWKKYPNWIASYTSQKFMENNVRIMTPWDTWNFWQWTSNGDGHKFGSEGKDIDLNYYNGDYQSLLNFCGLSSDYIPPENPVEIPEENNSIESIPSVGKVLIAKTGMNFRSEPNGNVQFLLSTGKQVVVTGDAVEKNGYVWLPVNYAGYIAYKSIHSDNTFFDEI